MEINFNRHFDIALAIGVFDYISRPRPFLEKMRSVAKEGLIMSFPSKSPIRTPIRKARYWWKRCPVYFYDRRMIETLVAGLGRYRILKIPGQGMDYFRFHTTLPNLQWIGFWSLFCISMAQGKGRFKKSG